MSRPVRAVIGFIAGGLPPFIAGNVLHWSVAVTGMVAITAVGCLLTGVLMGATS